MTQDLYRCSCGKGFKTAQGLAGHKRFCNEVTRLPKAQEHVEELQSRFSALEQKYNQLSRMYQESLKKYEQLEEKVNLLIEFVCPDGKNYVGLHSRRIIELAGDINAAKKDMVKREQAFEREIKGWVWEVIPKQFRPKI